jgi:hypothetical protein
MVFDWTRDAPFVQCAYSSPVYSVGECASTRACVCVLISVFQMRMVVRSHTLPHSLRLSTYFLLFFGVFEIGNSQ